MFKYRLQKLYYGNIFTEDMRCRTVSFGFLEDVILIELESGTLKIYKDLKNDKTYHVDSNPTSSLSIVYPLKNYYNVFGLKKKNENFNQEEVYKTVERYKSKKLI